MSLSWSKGERAEAYVAGRLELKGWTIAARNYRRRGFELDIIAYRANRLICIEVKGRCKSRHFDPSTLLDPRKIQRLYKGMNSWLQTVGGFDTSNAEFWLCYVELPREERRERALVQWMRLDMEEGTNGRGGFLSENN